jgi:ubiquitin C-terminal hydrolase
VKVKREWKVASGERKNEEEKETKKGEGARRIYSQIVKVNMSHSSFLVDNLPSTNALGKATFSFSFNMQQESQAFFIPADPIWRPVGQ